MKSSCVEGVQQNGAKTEKQYVFKVLLFYFSTEAETTTARNKESSLIMGGVSKRRGGVVFKCQPLELSRIFYLQFAIM